MSKLRQFIDNSNKVLCWLKQRQRIRLSNNSKEVKVNLGCGLSVANGWINVDASLNAFIAAWPKITHRFTYRFSGANRFYSFTDYHNILKNNRFVHHNLEKSIPFEDNSVDYVYSSHFLEHLAKTERDRLIAEIYRVLKPGGRVRIAVPDLDFAVSLYKLNEKSRMLDTYFFVEDRGSYFSRHKYMYDFELIKTLLETNGFKNILRRVYQKGNIPDLELLDKYPEDTLYVEAVKINL